LQKAVCCRLTGSLAAVACEMVKHLCCCLTPIAVLADLTLNRARPYAARHKSGFRS